jgi:hypothetical protein
MDSAQNGNREDSTGEFVTIIIKRSIPDRHRPRCSPECEERLAQVEQDTAACYGRSELLAARMRRLARAIDEETEKSADCPEVGCDRTLEDPVAPSWDDAEDSVVVHIDQLRAQAKID